MATFNNGESLSSVRTKINAAIDKVDGNATISNDITFGDNNKAIFGAGSDLEIYSDGTTGQLNGNINVIGTVTADGLTVDTDAYRRLLLTYPDAFTSKLQIGFSNFYVQGSATNDRLTIANNSSGQTHFENQSKTSMVIDNSGDISFYEDTGTTAKFFWDASTERLGIGNAAPATALNVTGTVDPTIRIQDTTNNAILDLRASDSSVLLRATSNHPMYLNTNQVNRVQIANNGDISFYEDTGTTAKFFWDASAESLGIGTVGPSTYGGLTLAQSSDSSSNGLAIVNNTLAQSAKLWTDATNAYLSSGNTGADPLILNAGGGNVGIGTSSPSAVLDIESTSATQLELKRSGTAGQIAAMIFKDGGDAQNRINSSGGALEFEYGASNLNALKIANNGDISFYEDQGITPKFVWKAADERLGLGTDSPDTNLHLEASTPVFRLTNPQSTSSLGLSMGKIEWETRDASAAGVIGYIDVVDSNNFGTTFDMAFATGQSGSATERMRIDSSGNVGISTSSPATTLDVAGTTTTDGLNLDAIAATISDTAVDIFVYDTRKDSDGGAWRKRTQGTSWYNETLSTSTRGSRKEFPAVAVIVTVGNEITIYDGDDPSLPMWMYFKDTDTAAGIMAYLNVNGGASCVSISMLNGKLSAGFSTSVGGLYTIDFLADTIHVEYNTSLGYNVMNSAIDGRNTVYSRALVGSGRGLVNRAVNDVAMTVLPNAPIDAATGLPVPTIAVATDGGVSVIKDDGTVVDDTATAYSNNEAGYITFLNDGRLAFSTRNSNVYTRITDIPTSDNSSLKATDVIIWNKGSFLSTTAIDVKQATSSNRSGHAYNKQTGTLAFGTAGKGLSLVKPDYIGNSDNEHFAAHIDFDYNTGWMNGDIKLATLSDTDATNVTGSELVTNGTFDTNTSGWTATTGTSLSVDTNRLKVTVNTGGDNAGYQVITTVSGYTYTLSATLQKGSTNGNALIRAGTGVASSAYGSSVSVTSTSATEVSFTFTATGTSTYITAICSNAGNHAFFDNISVRLAEEDRSVNGNGLQVFGTVTKSAVATGADLVGYSGFSASNYIKQPHNDDLSFGVGDFAVMGWAYPQQTSGTAGYLFDRGDSSGHSRVAIYIAHTNMQVTFYTTNSSGTAVFYQEANGWTDSRWIHLCMVRRGDEVFNYIDGKLVGSFSQPNSLNNDNAPLVIGNRYNYGNPFIGKLSLIRWSATAPSPEQILKMYNDEKFLFQENAQATLYGSSDAVTALAYDDTTELLHAGTSAGRSVFQGLRRVDNTTTAVGAAISASNGLVADE